MRKGEPRQASAWTACAGTALPRLSLG